MRKIFTTRGKRHFGVLVAGLVATTVLTTTPHVASASVRTSGISAFADDPTSADLDVQSGADWGPNAPMGRLQINGLHALVTRTPAIKATDTSLNTWNAVAPTLACKTNLSTNAATEKTATGTYVVESGQLAIRFTFDTSVGLEADACYMTKSDYVEKATNIAWPVTTAGLQAIYGIPASLAAAAKATLDATVPSVAKIYSQGTKFPTPPTLVKKLSAALPTQKFDIAFGGEDMSTAGTVYILRKGWKPHSLRIGTRSGDGNMVVLTYSARSKTSKYMTYPLEVMERVAEPTVTAKSLTPLQNSKYLPGAFTPIKPIVLSGFEDLSKTVLMSLSTSKGKLHIKYPLGLTPLFGYGTAGQPLAGSQLLFTGDQNYVNFALKQITLEMSTSLTDNKMYTDDVVLKAMAAEYTPGLTYFPATEHFYKYVAFDKTATNTFATATATAEASKELGLTGYLATVSSAEENTFVSTKIANATGTVVKNVFLAGSDATTEGDWKWISGPEKGTAFWNGCDSANGGKAVAGAFSGWATGEPNNWISNTNKCGGNAYDPTANGGENCLVTNRVNGGAADSTMIPGAWNDLPCTNANGNGVLGYVVEYGTKTTGGVESPSVFLANTTLVSAPAPKVEAAPNVFQRLTSFIGSFTKKIIPAVKGTKKVKPRPATVSHTLKVKLNVAGTYSITIKKMDGKGVPFAFQKGTKYKTESGKSITTTGERWNIIINTKKDGETALVTSILKNNEFLNVKNTKLFFRLVMSKADQENQMCMANWCQGATVPVTRVQVTNNADGTKSAAQVEVSGPLRAKVDAAGPTLP